MATLTVETICNQALTSIGAARIDSITDTTDKNSRDCNAIYEHVRNSVLTDHIWSFAQKRVALVESADPDPVWTEDWVTIAYDKPTDMLQLNFVNQPRALVKVEGSQILSDTSELQIKYTFELTDVTQFTSKFVEALGAKLAAELAISLANKVTLAEQLFTIYYEKKLPQAITIDSQQGTPLPPKQDEWTSARLIGSSPIVGQTGFDTWHPICGI